jgi:post-segregation antitoxin (ccd killing protein)
MSTTERVTVTLSADLVEGIDRLERNRSRFIAEAIEHELARRRHEALLSSVRNPHPDAAELADAGLGDWTADLPDGEGLVDVTGGTAVRWVEGHGWVKESE